MFSYFAKILKSSEYQSGIVPGLGTLTEKEVVGYH